MRILTKYYKEFLLRGLVAMGFGPFVLSVIYGILGEVGVIEQMSPSEVVLGYLTISLLAFICGASNVVFKIEELAISKAASPNGIEPVMPAPSAKRFAKSLKYWLVWSSVKVSFAPVFL